MALHEFLDRRTTDGADLHAPDARGRMNTKKDPMAKITIYHNPACATSGKALALIRASGSEPEVVEYLKAPPTREKLRQLLAKMGIGVRDILRRNGTPYEELGLDDPSLTEAQLLDAIVAHPILMNRPIVETATAARLCRPSELVHDLLANSRDDR